MAGCPVHVDERKIDGDVMGLSSQNPRPGRLTLLGTTAVVLLALLVYCARTFPQSPLARFNWPDLENFVRYLDQRIVALLFSGFTALVWLAIIHTYNIYVYKRGSVARLMVAFVMGSLLAYPTALAQQILSEVFPTPIPDRLPGNFFSTFLVIASTEEIFKFLAGYIAIIGMRKPTSLPEGAVLFGAAALGFATFENQLYFSNIGPQILPDRFLVSVLTHIGCTGIVGHYVVRAKLKQGTTRFPRIRALFIAIFLHGLYNALIFEGGGVAPFSLLVAGIILYTFHRHFISDVMDAMTHANIPPASGKRSVAWIIFLGGGALSIALGVGYNWIKTGGWPEPTYLLALIGIYLYLFYFYLREPDDFAVARSENLIYDGKLEEAKMELTRILHTQLGDETASHAAFLHGLIDLTEGSPWRALDRMKLVDDEDSSELRILEARCLACLGRHQELRALLRQVPRRTRERFLVALNLALAYLLVERPREALKIILHLPTKRRSWWFLDMVRNINRFRTFKSVGQGLFGHTENMRLLRTVKRSLLKQLVEGKGGLRAVVRLIWDELHRPVIRKVNLSLLRVPFSKSPPKKDGTTRWDRLSEIP